MKPNRLVANYSLGFETISFKRSMVVFADCFDWMARASEESIHAVVTDPPYGVKEYDHDQLQKRSEGNGGVWRIPPAFDGNVRSPLPRFTALNDQDRLRVQQFFTEWARLLLRAMVPGGHVFVASNAFLSQVVFSAIAGAGFEFRGETIRLVRTLRGGDRPKNAELEFPDVCSLPRGCYEPWGLFRKPLPLGMTVSACLAKYGTGGLRRKQNGKPFEDVIPSERTPEQERALAGHPSLKPQSFLRQIVYASLPLGKGVVLDPFMGSGSTIAAAEFLGYDAIGLERRREYFEISRNAIRDLSVLATAEDQLSFSFA